MRLMESHCIQGTEYGICVEKYDNKDSWTVNFDGFYLTRDYHSSLIAVNLLIITCVAIFIPTINSLAM